MKTELQQLREEIAKLRERVAVLEARTVVNHYIPPQLVPPAWPTVSPNVVTCGVISQVDTGILQS